MFGEDMLIGHNIVRLDEKHRIILPTYTKREKNDEILLIYDQDIDKYLLFSKKSIENKINKLETLIMEAKTEEERKKCKFLLYQFYESIIKRCHVDSGGRISLGNYFDDSDFITIIGANDHLILSLDINEQKLKKKKII